MDAILSDLGMMDNLSVLPSIILANYPSDIDESWNEYVRKFQDIGFVISVNDTNDEIHITASME